MNFEPQLQVSYADKTFSADKRQIKYASHDREGHFDPYVGIKQMMELIREEFPDLKFGYFNPPIERIKGDYATEFAHH